MSHEKPFVWGKMVLFCPHISFLRVVFSLEDQSLFFPSPRDSFLFLFPVFRSLFNKGFTFLIIGIRLPLHRCSLVDGFVFFPPSFIGEFHLSEVLKMFFTPPQSHPGLLHPPSGSVTFWRDPESLPFSDGCHPSLTATTPHFFFLRVVEFSHQPEGSHKPAFSDRTSFFSFARNFDLVSPPGAKSAPFLVVLR